MLNRRLDMVSRLELIHKDDQQVALRIVALLTALVVLCRCDHDPCRQYTTTPTPSWRGGAAR